MTVHYRERISYDISVVSACRPETTEVRFLFVSELVGQDHGLAQMTLVVRLQAAGVPLASSMADAWASSPTV